MDILDTLHYLHGTDASLEDGRRFVAGYIQICTREASYRMAEVVAEPSDHKRS